MFTITDDGLGHGVVEIRRVADGTVVGTSAPFVVPGSERTFRWVARSLRWRDGDTVQIEPGDGWNSTSVEELPAVTVHAEGANSPESTPTVRVVGGGYAGDAPPQTYSAALHVLLEELEGPDWTAWWSAAPDDVLEISYEVTVHGPARVVARRGGNKLRIRGERPLDDILAATDPVAMARADVEAIVATARHRAGLGPAPDLPDRARTTVAAQRRIETDAALVRRLHGLLDSLADRLPTWLLASLRADLDHGRTGDTIGALRIQLGHLAVLTTEAERTELGAIAATYDHE
ncbi:hypothetical protein GCM10009557_09310 [Virgisporangium ochraceum]|uniref:Uncharacterized protein n=1 Tax=Virgisporangium ochraceum TaxID=65505 RepID=A0A8J4A1B7_9ACTN|nr:hypothetical protein [Virgisporangium ochraceum]GIJ71420.1 hypothetical protein Voc01_063370 [Virgisporangium ochraceum]